MMATQERNWGKLEQVQEPQVHHLFMENDGVFPNNPNHPLLLFRGVCESEQQGRKLLVERGWTSPWVWGVFTYHHYHSNAWEVLICIKGSAEIQLGGPTLGPVVTVSKGDVILIPPGFAHKQLSDRDGFALLGSYPNETPIADTIRGAPSEEQMRNIQESCFVPTQEPVTNLKLSDLYDV